MFLKRSLLLLLLLLALLISAGGFIIGTSSGLNWAVRQADELLPGDLQLGKIKGNLFGHLTISNITYADPQTSLSAKQLELDWQPAGLLSAHLDIERFFIDQLQVDLHATEQEASEENKSSALEGIELPLSVRLGLLELRNPSIRYAADSDPIELEQATLAAELVSNQLRIHALTNNTQNQRHGRAAWLEPIGLHAIGRLRLPDRQCLARHQLALIGHPSSRAKPAR